MFRLAIAQLRKDPRRSILTGLGIAAVFGTILVLQGFRDGLYEQLREVAVERGADLIATQAGVRNIVGARSSIPQESRARVEAVEGVRAAYPTTTLPLIYERGGRKTPVSLVITDSLGGPARLEAGRSADFEGEVVVDRALARTYELGVGDTLELVGYAFRIVGVAEPTAALWTPFVFSNYDALIEFYFETDLGGDLTAFPLVSLLLIRLDPGARPEVVRASIEEAVAAVDVFTPGELAANDVRLGRTMLGSILEVLIGVAYLTGLLVLGLFIYTAVEGRRRDLGVLKAIGFSNRSLLVSVVSETAMIAVLALPVGLGLAKGISVLVSYVAPLYLVLPARPGPLYTALGACAAFVVIGAIAPLRAIGRLEPGEVFRR